VDAVATKGRATRVLIAAYAGLALAFALATLRVVASPNGIVATDFSVFSTAWWLILNGQGAAIYDVSAQTAAQHVVMGGAQFEGGLLAFLNPPHAALAGIPFGWLRQISSAPVAFASWTVLNLVLLVLLDRWLRITVGAGTGSTRWIVTFALVAFYPVFEVIKIGQLSILLAVAVLGLYRATLNSRPLAGAAWLLVISVKPQLMLPLLVFLVIRRSFTLLGYFALMSIMVGVVTAIVLGPMIWIDYLRHVGALEHFFATGTPEYMFNVRGLLAREAIFLQPQTTQRIAYAGSIVATACLGIVFWRWRIHDAEDVQTAYALAVATALLFSPHLFVQDTVIWAVPLALAAERAWTLDHRHTIVVLSLTLPVLFAAAHFSAGLAGLRVSLDLQFALLAAAALATARMAYSFARSSIGRCAHIVPAIQYCETRP
jgi:hypothetical protein